MPHFKVRIERTTINADYAEMTVAAPSQDAAIQHVYALFQRNMSVAKSLPYNEPASPNVNFTVFGAEKVDADEILEDGPTDIASAGGPTKH